MIYSMREEWEELAERNYRAIIKIDFIFFKKITI